MSDEIDATFDSLPKKITLRSAERADTPLILQFITELAEYQKLQSEVNTNVETLEHWLFDKCAAEVIIAEINGEKAGFALFFSNFSTFLGKSGLYLEDLYIKPQYRRFGIGKAVLSRLAQIAAERDYERVEWGCLDWNKPSIDFYLSLGAKTMSDLTIYRLSGDKLRELAERK